MFRSTVRRKSVTPSRRPARRVPTGEDRVGQRQVRGLPFVDRGRLHAAAGRARIPGRLAGEGHREQPVRIGEPGPVRRNRLDLVREPGRSAHAGSWGRRRLGADRRGARPRGLDACGGRDGRRRRSRGAVAAQPATRHPTTRVESLRARSIRVSRATTRPHHAPNGGRCPASCPFGDGRSMSFQPRDTIVPRPETMVPHARNDRARARGRTSRLRAANRRTRASGRATRRVRSMSHTWTMAPDPIRRVEGYTPSSLNAACPGCSVSADQPARDAGAPPLAIDVRGIRRVYKTKPSPSSPSTASTSRSSRASSSACSARTAPARPR